MTFDNAAPCATRCSFCTACVHYRTNVRIQQRRERQARDGREPPPPPPEPAPSPAKRARTISQEPFVDVLLAAARDPLAVPQSAPARLATPFFSDAAMAPPPPRTTKRPRADETPPVDKAPPALSPTPPERRPELAREAPAQPFEIVAVDDSPPEDAPAPPPVPALSTQVTPLDEELLDLAWRLLKWEPSQRMSAAQALREHPALARRAPPSAASWWARGWRSAVRHMIAGPAADEEEVEAATGDRSAPVC